MAKKTDDVQPEGGDLAAVNEPTRYAETEAPQEEPKFVIATTELFVHGVRAHNAGDRVPAQNVDRWGWSGSVRPE